MVEELSYSIAEAAQALNLSTKTIRRYIKSGKLPSKKVPSKFGEEYRITALPDSLKGEDPPVKPETQPMTTEVTVQRTEQVSTLDALQLYQENIRLAAQLGAATERIRNLEDQLKLLQAPKPLPWWRRLFKI